MLTVGGIMAEAKAETGGDDPSMEEILQSIRRIIAEDETEESAAASENESFDSDVLELTEMVQDDGTTVSLNEPVNSAPLDVLASIDNVLSEEDPVPETPAKPAPAEALVQAEEIASAAELEATVIPAHEPDDALLSDTAAHAATDAFRKLARPQTPTTRRADPVSFRSGDTVEDLVVEALKPMLKEWLDANLPALVERIVEREVRRVSGE